MPELPVGTVTFLFSDIEGSTAILHRLGEDTYRRLLDEHNRLLREALASGVEVSTEGDSFFYVFDSAPASIKAALDGQQALLEHRWPEGGTVRVRMGLHTGEGRLGGDNYAGADVNRAARIAAAGHGGQVLVSEATRILGGSRLRGDSFRDLGDHRFKGIPEPERVFQLMVPGLPADFPPIRSLDSKPNNLPARTSDFVGRDRETAEVEQLLSKSRLVTITGLGGAGKSRLAIHVASRIQNRFEHGVVYVPLDGIRDPELVVTAIANACSVVDDGRPALDALVDHFRDRSMLLLLDTFEHVLAAGHHISELLEGTPRVHILVTSQALLRIRGERSYPLPPLDSRDAIELFLDRAAEADPGFRISPEEQDLVEELIARLESSPLALELAAARLRLFGLTDLHARLTEQLELGQFDFVDAPERHRTLEAAITWSYDLLDGSDQTAFREISVFDGFVLDAAEAVMSLEHSTEAIASLLDKSLLQRDVVRGEARFHTLDSVRRFAQAKLDESGEADIVRGRHATYYGELGEKALSLLETKAQDVWLERLTAEQGNIRAVVDHCLAAGQPDPGLKAVGGTWRFYQRRGKMKEAVGQLEALLALTGASPRPRVLGLGGLASLHYWQERFELATEEYLDTLELARELGDRRLEAETLASLAFTMPHLGRPDEGENYVQLAIKAFNDAGLPERARRVLTARAFSVWNSGDYEAAERAWTEAAAVFGELGDRSEQIESQLVLAVIAHQRGRTIESIEALGRVLEDVVAIGGMTGLAMTLDFLASIVANVDPPRALMLAGATSRLRGEVGGGMTPAHVGLPTVEELVADQLDEAELVRLRTEGEAMGLERAIDLARSVTQVSGRRSAGG